MQRELWPIFLLPKMPIFLNLARGNNKECNLKKSDECQISQILGLWKIYRPIESIESKTRPAAIF